MNRTLLVTYHFPPEVGGAERYLDTLTQRLDPLSLFVVAPPSPGAATIDVSRTFRIVRKNLLAHPFVRPGWFGNFFWTLRLVRRERITRVLFGHYAGFVSLGLMLRFLLGIPYVVTVFGLDFISYRRSLLRRVLLRINLRHAEWVVTISSFTRDRLHDFGVPLGKIVIAAPGIEVPLKAPRGAVDDFRRKFKVQAPCILLTVARLVKRKGHGRILKALPRVLREFPDLLYLIVGEGPLRKQLEQQAESLGIAQSVRFLGNIDNHDLSLAYSATDAFIMLPSTTSNDAEGFGIVYLEALAAGKPIIATKSGGVVDIIEHRKNGIALDEDATNDDIAKAIIGLFRDRHVMEEYGALGASAVHDRFSLQRQCAPFQRILQDVPRSRTAAPNVSIVVPFWNSIETLAKTLNSIAAQTYKDLELIVVDDGSTDRPDEITGRFREVKLICQEHAGAPAARNRGFRESTGAFVLFCDADVSLHPRMIERMVTTLELHPEASYAYSSFRFGWRTFDLFDFDAHRLRESNYISTMSLIRREAFPGFDESLTRLQDWDLWLTMLDRANVGVWVPARLFSASIGKKGYSGRLRVPPTPAVDAIKRKHHLATP